MKLTQRNTATGVTLNNSIIHIVNTDDTSQDPTGSSYKAPLSLLMPLFSGGSTSSSYWASQTGALVDTNTTIAHTTLNTNTDSIIGGGKNNKLDNSDNAVIIGGLNNNILTGDTSLIIGGQNNDIQARSGSNLSESGILGGSNNNIVDTTSDSDRSFIIGGVNNNINDSFNSTIIGSALSNITNTSQQGFILGGSNVDVISSTYSGVIGGSGNVINNADRSVIIGGQNITGTTNDTVYVPNLNIGTLGGGASVNNLGIDSNGNVVVGSSGSGGTIVSDNYWTSGSSGNYSVKTINDSTTDATNTYAVSLGWKTLASGIVSYAQGSESIASGGTSHAEGNLTVAGGSNSHAEGLYSKSFGYVSHAEGNGTIASGNSSHSEGFYTTAIGSGSHSQNSQTTAIGGASHAGGSHSTASGNTSFIHSTNSLVTGDRSVVLGGQNITGTTNDTVYVPKIEVAESDEGIVLKSSGGFRYKITVDDAGNLVTTAV